MDQLMLYHPSGARTATSLALVWDKVPGAECYQVLLNGRMEGIAACTDYTAEHLRPETSYTCEVRAVARDGKLLTQSNTLPASTKRQGELFDIRDFGAKGDGITLNTEAIQAAINACSEEGIVYIPEGVFLTGALHLKSHSLIASQDDCIAVKSGRDEDGRKRGVPSENIRITNCTFLSGFGVAMGSEMSGGIRNVLVQDCVFEDAYSVGSVKAPLYRGGVIENITYADCRISNYGEHRDTRWFRGAIYVDQYYHLETFDPDESHPVTEGTPVIRNITFRNIVLDTATGNAIFLAGLPEAPLENITLENVTALGKTGMKAYNINGLHMKNVSVSAREGEAVMLHNVNAE